jgi:hypothetical protein
VAEATNYRTSLVDFDSLRENSSSYSSLQLHFPSSSYEEKAFLTENEIAYLSLSCGEETAVRQI